ncbi:MAG: hypothetical protein WC528_02595 [Patescibacteria group bacterium]
MKRIFFLVILIILVLIFQLNILYFISSLSSLINPFLIIAVLLLLLYDLKISFFWVLVGAFLIDIYSINFFGLYLITYVLTIYVANFFFKRFFTNRSLYSFIIISMIATISYFVFLAGFSQLFYYIHISPYSLRLDHIFFLSVLYQTMINAFIMGLAYFIALYVSDHLKANFIFKKQF